MSAYTTARQSGLLPPFALAVAAWKSTPSIAAQIRSLHPSGAALIFGAAYLAGLAGSVAAPLCVAAFLAGLWIVKQPAAPIYLRPKSAAQPSPSPAQPTDDHAVKVAGHPLADTLAATGLVVREVKLAQPSANGRAAKVSAK